jgi:hypothetical protein
MRRFAFPFAARRPTGLSVLVALVALLALSLAIPPAFAAGGGGGEEGQASQKDKMTKRPRYDAALTGGHLIQLETLWVPVVVGKRRQYLGMTVHLIPAPDKMADACYVTPWVTEALVTHFNATPLNAAARRDLAGKAMTDALMALVNKVAGKGVFSKVELIDAPPGPLEPEDGELSLACV